MTKGTDKEKASPTQHEIDTNDKFEAIWTTENLENATLHHDESEEERRASTASSIPLEEITSDTNHLNLLTESSESATYRYDNDATESSRFDESHPDAQEDSMTSKGGGTVPSGTATTFEPQLHVLPPEQAGSHPSANNSVANHGDTTDRILLLDEPAASVTKSDSTFVEETTMTSDFADKIRGNDTKILDFRERSLV